MANEFTSANVYPPGWITLESVKAEIAKFAAADYPVRVRVAPAALALLRELMPEEYTFGAAPDLRRDPFADLTMTGLPLEADYDLCGLRCEVDYRSGKMEQFDLEPKARHDRRMGIKVNNGQ